MAFYGCEFVFDNIPCSDYGLMIYDIGGNKQSDVTFKSGSISEDRINGRYDALTYGLVQNEALEFTLVFGASLESMDAGGFIDRLDTEAISSWLTGHQQRKWLSIIQDDMTLFRYKCMITDLKLITDGGVPTAFSCTVNCDSPFAYYLPESYTYSVDGSAEIDLFNRSSYNGYYKPVLSITISGGGDFIITNTSDNNRVFGFEKLPTGELAITVDNKNQIITNSQDINLYPYLKGMKFLRLVRGNNHLKITGTGTVTFDCEFPADIGG